MKFDDLYRLKGSVKDAAVKWAHLMVDRMLPDYPKIRTLLKNGAHNVVARYDEKANSIIDGLSLLLADESGVVDSDRLVDAVADVLDEMPVTSLDLFVFRVEAGKGEVVLRFPSVVGDLQGVRLTREDIQEMKQFILN